MIAQTRETDLAAAIASADGPFRIVGGGTRGIDSTEGDVLSVAGLSGIERYEPGALTLVARAGTPVAEIEAALEAEGQMLPFEPYDLAKVTGATGQSTIGGVFATNTSGSRRIQVGAARDFLLGVRFVDGAGNIVKNGGRVMKNVTGYDLVKLMAGSHGTLGVMTEVSFKVLPKHETQATLMIEGLSDPDAVRAMSAALGSPFDVSGALSAPDCIEDGGCTMIRIEGFADSVAYRTEKLKDVLKPFGEVHVAEGREGFESQRNLTAFTPVVRGNDGVLWRLSVKPSDGPALMDRIAAAHDCLYSYDWGGGRIWVWAEADQKAAALHVALQDEARAVGGHATLTHSASPLAGPRFQPEAAPIAKLTEAIRRKFDPRGILNPGLMG